MPNNMKKFTALGIFALALNALAWFAVAQDRSAPDGGQALLSERDAATRSSFLLRSHEVADGGQLPRDYTGDGTSSTLPLEWTGAPEGTRSFALIMHHIPGPGDVKWYWIIYDIPADVKSLAKNVKGVGTLGNNSVNGRMEYAPPHSKGPGPKTYIYTLYALSAPLKITVPATEVNRQVLLDAMQGLILESAELRVIYTRFATPGSGNQPDRPGNPPRPPDPVGADGNGPTLMTWIIGCCIAIVPLLLAGFNSTCKRCCRLPWVHRMLLVTLVCSHFCLLLMYFAPAIGTPDASGYFVQTRLLANAGHTWFQRQSPLQYVNHHWLNNGGDQYFSQYPPGLSALTALVFRLGGPSAALLVNPVLASLTLLGLYLLSRLWIDAGWSLLAAALLAVNPITNEHALSCDSHTAVTFLLIWGIYLLVLWSRRQSFLIAFSAAMVFGLIPTIRYPEALFLVAAGLFMIMHLFGGHKPWKSIWTALAGMLIPITCLSIRNYFAFGAFWKTGYTLTNEQAAFALDKLLRKAAPYIAGIMYEGTGWLAAIGLLVMAGLCLHRTTRREGILLWTLTLPVTVLYMAYTLPETSLRFLIPTFSIYILAAAWGFKLLADRLPRVAVVFATVTFVATVSWGLPRSASAMERLKQGNAALATITQLVTEHVAQGNIVIADPQIQQQLDYIGAWNLIDESILTGDDHDSGGPPPDHDRELGRESPLRRNLASGPRAVHEQERRRIMDRYTDRVGPVVSGRMLADLDAWRGTGKVYWIGNLAQMRRLLPPSDQLRVMRIIKVDCPGCQRTPPAELWTPDADAPRPPRDLKPLNDVARTRPAQRTGQEELVLAEWTRAASQ